MLKIYVLYDLSSFECVEIMPIMLLQIEMCVNCDLICDLNVWPPAAVEIWIYIFDACCSWKFKLCKLFEKMNVELFIVLWRKHVLNA
jgi:hypothetical protein